MNKKKELSWSEKLITRFCIWSLTNHDFFVFWVQTISFFLFGVIIFSFLINKMTGVITIISLSFLLLIYFFIMARKKHLNMIEKYPEAKEAHEAMLKLIKRKKWLE